MDLSKIGHCLVLAGGKSTTYAYINGRNSNELQKQFQGILSYVETAKLDPIHTLFIDDGTSNMFNDVTHGNKRIGMSALYDELRKRHAQTYNRGIKFSVVVFDEFCLAGSLEVGFKIFETLLDFNAYLHMADSNMIVRGSDSIDVFRFKLEWERTRRFFAQREKRRRRKEKKLNSGI